jgi:transcriptional regulator with XRE-family HTH domain
VEPTVKYEPSHLARLLRRARENLKLSRQALADEIGYTASYVEKVERGEEPVRTEYLKRVGATLAPGVDVPGLLAWLHDEGLRRPIVSDWLRPYLEIEKQADVIRWFEPLLFPGLLQVEGYARALLDTEEQVAARMARQEILAGADRPEVVAIVDESVLHGHVAGPDVMAEQLAHLAETPAVVQVLPADTDIYPGLNGSFVLATVGRREYVYVETPARGFTLEDPEIVSQVRHDWEVLRGEALTSRQSRDLILKAAERWKSQSG